MLYGCDDARGIAGAGPTPAHCLMVPAVSNHAMTYVTKALPDRAGSAYPAGITARQTGAA